MNERTAAIVPFRCVTKHARCVWAFCTNCGPIYQSYDGFSSIDALRFTLTDGNLTDNRTLTSKRGLDGLRITFWAVRNVLQPLYIADVNWREFG